MFEKLLGTTSKIDEFLDSSKENPSIVLYGAGFALSDIVKKLEKHGFSIAAICDSDARKHGSVYNDTYPIMGLEEAQSRFPQARFMISSPVYFDEIYALLSKTLDKDLLSEVDLTCAYFFQKGEFATFFAAELPRFEAVYDSFEDDRSRETYFNVIKAHMTGERKDFEHASTGSDDWYLFNTLLKPVSDTVHVDCGAYDGDTVKLFANAADQGYRKIFALEPDPAMLPSLEALSSKHGGTIEVIPKVVADRDGMIRFMANGVFSNIVEGDGDDDGSLSIPVTTLDSLFLAEGVSSIKMDIEGGEYDAVKGATELIQRYRPKLAICLYHRVDDLVRIAELVKQMMPEYKIRLEHQSKSCTDTILFATLD